MVTSEYLVPNASGRRPISVTISSTEVTIQRSCFACTFQLSQPFARTPSPPAAEDSVRLRSDADAAPRVLLREVLMAPKAAPTPFEVDGVQCTVKAGLVNVGLNAGWPRELRFPVKVKPTATLDETKEKVRAHDKFAALVAHATPPACQPQLQPPPPPPQQQPQAPPPPPPPLPSQQKRQRLSVVYCTHCVGYSSTVAHACPKCGTAMCSLECSRRRPECPHFPVAEGDSPTYNGLPLAWYYQTMAEMAAGIGCMCACCRSATDQCWWDLEEESLHDGAVDLAILRDALAAAGNPPCRAAQVLARCEACTGACGLDTLVSWFSPHPRLANREPGTWACGQDELESVVEDLICRVCEGHGEGGPAPKSVTLRAGEPRMCSIWVGGAKPKA